jgi:CheY-like chemotaxis protein
VKVGEPSRRQVLLVDDDPLIVEVLSTILDLEHFSVRTAQDGQSALSALAEERPDVLVCDVMMPGLDGFEVCRRVKSDASTADLPVILLTARDREQDRVAGQAAGCDAYITKPFSPLGLIEVIEQVRVGTSSGAGTGSAAGTGTDGG